MPTLTAADKLTFAYEPYPPYEFDQGGTSVGTDVDIIKAVCARSGYEAKFVSEPWKRCEEEVKAGTVDAIFSLFKTDEREKFLYFPSQNLSYERDVIIAKNGTQKVYNLEGLNGKSVGTVVEYSYGDAFDNATKQNLFKNEVCPNNEQLLLMLDGGRMQYAIINDLVYNSLTKKLSNRGAFEILYPQVNDPMYVAFSKAKGDKEKKVAEQFSKVILEMKQNGEIKRIMQKY
jgi:polar amino acid transport system substrate-binding protein